MKHHKQSLPEFLDQSFARFRELPHEQVESSCDRALDRIRDDADSMQATPVRPLHLPRRRLGFAAIAPVRTIMIALTVVTVIILAVVFRQKGREIYRTNGDTGTVLSLADGSRVEMRANSELSLERANDGVRIRLSKGSVIVNAARQRTGHLYVQTKDMTVSVVGTVFLVNAEEQGSRVAVIEGEVRVQLPRQPGATPKKLLSGEQVATNPSMESQPVSQEISWSRNAEAHLALLQQSVPPPPEPPIAPRVGFEVASLRRASADGGRGAAGGGMSILPSGCGGRLPIQIDPRRFAVSGTTLHTLITWAYGTGKMNYAECRTMSALNLVSGGPAWIRSDLWDVQAVIPEGEAAQLQRMLQAFLSEHFNLVMRRETKEVPAYTLTAEKGAPRTAVRSEIDTPQFREMRANQTPGIILERGAILVKNAPIADLIPILEQDVGRPVLDQTGLAGEYSFVVEYTPLYRIQNGGTPFFGPAIFAALPEQVGLRLEPAKTTVDVWVVEGAEKPKGEF